MRNRILFLHRYIRLFVYSLLFVLPLSLFAGIPEGYYAAAQGLHDSLLRQALFDTIRGGERIHYGTQGYTYPDQVYYPGTWNYFPLTDKRADGYVWDMYSNTKRYFTHDGGSSCGLEIEHCLPKSWWGYPGNDSIPSSKRAAQDLYILNPADGQANGQKSNYPPGHVVAGDKFDNGSFRMDSNKKSQYGWMCFEPAEAYRGDFARTYFYAVTAYADLPFGAGNREYQRYLCDSTYLVFKPWLVDVLLDWHRNDPVSRKEIERADAIYQIQGNRNPYIDYPELVEYIWGTKKGECVDFSSLLCTADETYSPDEDFTNFEAFVPNDVSTSGFTAAWSDFCTDYTLDVYQYVESGKNDTIVNMPAMGSTHIKNAAHIQIEGKVQSTAAGTNAITMGSGSTDGAVVVCDMGLQAPALLRFRASIYKTATAGELHIFMDEHTAPDSIILLPTTRDEMWYDIPLPAETDKVTIASVGGKTTKRACMQALYVVQGDYKKERKHLSGYPITTADCTCHVELKDYTSSKPVYYQVITTEGLYSNEVRIDIPTLSDIKPTVPQPNMSTPSKVLHKQQVLIMRNGAYYDLLGRPVNL